MVTQDSNDFVFNYRNPKISDGAVGQWAIKIHPLYPGYLLRSYKKTPHLSRKGGSRPFHILFPSQDGRTKSVKNSR